MTLQREGHPVSVSPWYSVFDWGEMGNSYNYWSVHSIVSSVAESVDITVDIDIYTIKSISGFPGAGTTVNIPYVIGLVFYSGGFYYLDPPGMLINNFFNVNYLDVSATCSTPSVVNHTLHVGSVGPAYDFSIDINNCPSWMRSVRYKLMAAQPGGGETVPSNSTLPLLTGSTASGVGVQIRNQNDTLHPFNVWQGVGYNHATGGNYSVRIIRTAANAQPGKVEAAIIFHMEYK